MDFYRIVEREEKKGYFTVYPDFKIGVPSDFMVRGKAFYAVWDGQTGLWSTDETKVQEIIDRDIFRYIAEQQQTRSGTFIPKLMSNFSSNIWKTYKQYVASMPDNARQLDVSLTYQNSETKKEDYRSKRLPYSFEQGECRAWNTLVERLYSKEEREKIEWAIGSIVAGDSKDIQKFVVFYGDPGSGKGTILNIIQMLFDGYYNVFDARSLGSAGSTFAMESFKTNPLVAIQADGDLSRIEDNTRINSIISHEVMQMNEKFKSAYPIKLNSFLFIGSNKPVKITDAKSGIIRRLIDVTPSGKTFSPSEYQKLMSDIKFELGQIAWHCFGVYQDLGKHYYDGYRPIGMMFKTDVFYNFVEDSYEVFTHQDGVSLTQAYNMYKQYCEEGTVEYVLPKYRFREELKNYFRSYEESANIGGRAVRSYYSGFRSDRFERTVIMGDKKPNPERDNGVSWLSLSNTESNLDMILSDCPAQYANEDGIPSRKWDNCHTCLKDIDTSKLHYVKPPINHIVIDFDLRDNSGQKSREANLEAASKWPMTYAEWSKSGSGIHLHYIYSGDVTTLSPIYDDSIEVKVFIGNSSLRRQFSYCNGIGISTISSGLPRKDEKMINGDLVMNEKSIRRLIVRNLKKEIHPGTKPSVDFIKKILDDAYNSGISYDVSDMYGDILAFANNSTNHGDFCVKMVSEMKFKSDDKIVSTDGDRDSPLVFFDTECFPNLFMIRWKIQGEDKIATLINPSPNEIEPLLHMKLVGFNCRKYDNHLVWAAYLGYKPEQLYELSQKMINDKKGFFGAAYNLSYTDVYDFASAGNKQSLKKFEIDLGIHHQELGLPWDQPVPEDKWSLVEEYCGNDVFATEATFEYLKGDWTARQILAKLSGLSVNDTTNEHSKRIIFGSNKHPQGEFIYTDLSKTFPGYEFKDGVSTYRGDKIGEGGWARGVPGIWYNVMLDDIESMHPSTIEALNLFGDRYTKRFSELKQARIFIKHGEYTRLNDILDGELAEFVPMIASGEINPKDLSNALKTVINSVYGLTAAKFDNEFRDPRNVDNIVAKRGALFMRMLQDDLYQKGYIPCHIKTDSVKVPNWTPEIKDYIYERGQQFGYKFDHEATYERMCLVNDAVYIAKYADGPHAGEWTATGTQFAVPYVFKTLFSKEPIQFDDMCECKSVKEGAIYIDMANDPDNPDLRFVGRVGNFCPVKTKGGTLYRVKDGKKYAVTGTKGWQWLEAEVVRELGIQDDIDLGYFDQYVKGAIDTIAQFGDVDQFINGPVPAPWEAQCTRKTCSGCPNFVEGSFHMICKAGHLIDELEMIPLEDDSEKNHLAPMFSTGKNDWETPQELFDELNSEFHFTLDPCAEPATAKCKKFYTKEDDGLSKDWTGEIVFCNPPYSDKQQTKWVKKCYEHWKNGGTAVMLIPARTDTKRFHEYINGIAEVRFLKGRIKFGNAKNSAPFPSMIVVFKPT